MGGFWITLGLLSIIITAWETAAITNKRRSQQQGGTVRDFRHIAGPSSANIHTDWEVGLREATNQALLREGYQEPNLRDRLYEASLIGRQDTATPFGDIAVLARGQLYVTHGGSFAFVQDPYQNDCDDCHNARRRCIRSQCEILKPHQDERLVALWTVKRLRHRDYNNIHRYELEYTISPISATISEGFVTRNGYFDYAIPGHVFVVKNGEGQATKPHPTVIYNRKIPHRHFKPEVLIGVSPDGRKHILHSYPGFYTSFPVHPTYHQQGYSTNDPKEIELYKALIESLAAKTSTTQKVENGPHRFSLNQYGGILEPNKIYSTKPSYDSLLSPQTPLVQLSTGQVVPLTEITSPITNTPTYTDVKFPTTNYQPDKTTKPIVLSMVPTKPTDLSTQEIYPHTGVYPPTEPDITQPIKTTIHYFTPAEEHLLTTDEMKEMKMTIQSIVTTKGTTEHHKPPTGKPTSTPQKEDEADFLFPAVEKSTVPIKTTKKYDTPATTVEADFLFPVEQVTATSKVTKKYHSTIKATDVEPQLTSSTDKSSTSRPTTIEIIKPKLTTLKPIMSKITTTPKTPTSTLKTTMAKQTETVIITTKTPATTSRIARPTPTTTKITMSTSTTIKMPTSPTSKMTRPTSTTTEIITPKMTTTKITSPSTKAITVESIKTKTTSQTTTNTPPNLLTNEMGTPKLRTSETSTPRTTNKITTQILKTKITTPKLITTQITTPKSTTTKITTSTTKITTSPTTTTKLIKPATIMTKITTHKPTRVKITKPKSSTTEISTSTPATLKSTTTEIPMQAPRITYTTTKFLQQTTLQEEMENSDYSVLLEVTPTKPMKGLMLKPLEPQLQSPVKDTGTTISVYATMAATQETQQSTRNEVKTTKAEEISQSTLKTTITPTMPSTEETAPRITTKVTQSSEKHEEPTENIRKTTEQFTTQQTTSTASPTTITTSLPPTFKFSTTQKYTETTKTITETMPEKHITTTMEASDDRSVQTTIHETISQYTKPLRTTSTSRITPTLAMANDFLTGNGKSPSYTNMKADFDDIFGSIRAETNPTMATTRKITESQLASELFGDQRRSSRRFKTDTTAAKGTKIIYANFFEASTTPMSQTTEGLDTMVVPTELHETTLELKPLTSQSYSTSISFEVNKKNKTMVDNVEYDPAIKATISELMKDNEGYTVYKAELPVETTSTVTAPDTNPNIKKAFDDVALQLVNHARSINTINMVKKEEYNTTDQTEPPAETSTVMIESTSPDTKKAFDDVALQLVNHARSINYFSTNNKNRTGTSKYKRRRNYIPKSRRTGVKRKN